MDPFGRLKIEPPSGGARTAPIPPAVLSPKPPPGYGDEPPLKPISSLGLEYLVASGAALRIVEGGATALSAGTTLFKLGVGGTVAETLIGAFATGSIGPAESAIGGLKEAVLSRPPGPQHSHPFFDPTAPFVSVYRTFVKAVAADTDPARLEIEKNEAMEQTEAFNELIDKLRVAAGKIAAQPATDQTIAQLTAIRDALTQLNVHEGGTKKDVANLTFIAVGAAIERQRQELYRQQEIAKYKGAGGLVTRFEFKDIDP